MWNEIEIEPHILWFLLKTLIPLYHDAMYTPLQIPFALTFPRAAGVRECTYLWIDNMPEVPSLPKPLGRPSRNYTGIHFHPDAQLLRPIGSYKRSGNPLLHQSIWERDPCFGIPGVVTERYSLLKPTPSLPAAPAREHDHTTDKKKAQVSTLPHKLFRVSGPLFYSL